MAGDPATAYQDILEELTRKPPRAAPVEPTTGPVEAAIRGALSSATLGLSDWAALDDPTLPIKKKLQQSRVDSAMESAISAGVKGDGSDVAAEATLAGERAKLADLEARDKSINAAARAKSAALLEEHPVAHGIGSVLGAFAPGGAVGLAGRLGGKAAGVAGRLVAEGAAVGTQGSVEQAAATGDLAAGKIAGGAIRGAALSALIGVGGLGLSQVAGKLARAGSSRILGSGGADVAAASARAEAAAGELSVIEAAAARDPALSSGLASVRAAHADGLLARADDVVLGGARRATAEESAAVAQLSTLQAGLRKAGVEGSPLSALDALSGARKAIADGQAAIQEHAAHALKEGVGHRLEGLLGAGGAAHGFAAHGGEDSDPISQAIGTVKGALIGIVAGKIGGAVAGSLLGGRTATTIASAAEGAAGIAARAVPALARAGTEAAIHLLPQDQYDATAKHVRQLALARADVEQATTAALSRAGWSASDAVAAGARRGAAIQLLADGAGDRVTLSRMIGAVSAPQAWGSLATSGRLGAEHVAAMSAMAPAPFAAVAEQARQMLADRRAVARMTPARRRMLETVAGTAGATVGAVQQHGFGASEKAPTSGISGKQVPPPTAAQGAEARLNKE